MRRFWAVQRFRRRLAARTCGCGQQIVAPGTTLELRGVSHRLRGPCFPCDPYGDPLL